MNNPAAPAPASADGVTTDGMPPALAEALEAWARALGPDRVTADAEELERRGRSTIPGAAPPLAVVRPCTRDEVVETVRIADRLGIPLYPISGGKNTGFGDACPPTPGQVLLDLAGMNRIVEVDPELAYAVLEPGVSQQQLHAHLREAHIPLWMPSTGSSPEASIVANALERGWGHSVYGDHFANLCGLEVVLADGSVVQTGFSGYAGSRLGPVSKSAPGPYVDGLFTQANLGIVTRAGVWLIPQPEDFRVVVVRLHNQMLLGQLIDRLRPLRLNGTLATPMHLSNRVRSITYRRRYPWEEARGVTPLPGAVVRGLAHEYGYADWVGFGALLGTAEQTEASGKAIRRALEGVAEVRVLSRQRVRRISRVAAVAARLGNQGAAQLVQRLGQLAPGFDLLQGIPTSAGLGSCRWRVRDLECPDSLDPLDNACGMYWFAPVCPMTGRDLEHLLQLTQGILREHRLDPVITVTLTTGRALLVTVQVLFDKSDPEECERAAHCNAALVEAATTEGYPPYRHSIASMGRLPATNPAFWKMASRIKQALDPNGIIAPGRYIPRERL